MPAAIFWSRSRVGCSRRARRAGLIDQAFRLSAFLAANLAHIDAFARERPDPDARRNRPGKHERLDELDEEDGPRRTGAVAHRQAR
jgi:hypothetical protein